ncbi:Arc family DNA-binding protein [Paraburkholderia tropica]|uniref:Arc family DNA-binding protein n=1 Tax=Paraburkholderia tropica TaxID=92647 RepID=UPI003019C841
MTESQKPPSRTADQFVVRFPDGMRDRIAEEAKKNNRSMNAEIVARLEESFAPRSDEEVMRLLTRIAINAADAERNALDKSRQLAALAAFFRKMSQCLPSGAFDENPDLRAEVDRWLNKAKEISDDFGNLDLDGENLMDRAMDALKHMGDAFRAIKDQQENPNIEREPVLDGESPASAGKRSRKLDI